ncbi:efflux RND transporter periplasmic adaptor subunit [Paenibacillus wulumuqiensis]|uniref:efflux RND transporter periplasmic adaptor subunit n=1 Tax=Paenibacillus wulumuqiensis TaxID=1567107 RepID=UPI0006198952|nr:efflux RND transporter periplasmic adaptor subunit [Paenibacillus wulumuqiensis]
MKRGKWEVTAAALVLSTTLLAGCSTGNEAAQAMNVTVKVSQAQKGMLGQGNIYTGTVNPSATVNIMPKIAGKVDNVTVDVGAQVKPGQVLFRLDDDDLRNKLKIAQSDAKAAQAGVKTAETSRETGVVSASSGLVSSKNGIISSKSAITQAQSGINQAQAAVNQANTAVKQAQTAISTAGNTIKQTQEALATAKSTLTRTQSLADNGLATQAQLEQAQAAVVSAQTAYDNAVNGRANAQEQLEAARNSQVTAQKGLATAQSAYENANSSYTNASEGYNNAQRQLEVSQSTAGVEASRQKVEQAQVNIDIARDALDNAVVKSPINGIVVTKNVEAGEMVSSAAPSLVIANLDQVNILIYVPAEEINGIQAGDRVQVSVASSGIVANGKVKNINPMDASGNGYPVEVAVSNPDGKLKTGMLADVSFVGDDAKEGIIVPTKAIQQDGKQSYVYTAAKGRAVRKPVTVGITAGSQSLITKGLNAGDQVISNNAALLDENTTVQIASNH